MTRYILREAVLGGLYFLAVTAIMAALVPFAH